MAKVRDRTEDFKDAVRHTALSLGYDESKLAAILANFIIHKPRQRSPFIKAALKTLESIGTLEPFMVKHRKDYVDLHRTTEQERDSIEHEGAETLSCFSLTSLLGPVIDRLEKISLVSELPTPRRKFKPAAKSSSKDTSKSNNLDFREPDQFQTEPPKVQQQHLDDETRALQVELSSLLDAVQQTETKMVEMSALNHLMATHVLRQAQQIEQLYLQYVFGIC
ncbi:hypothetical protein TIFTF001_026203 [Ficus carica]|uniref:SNARE-complex protein Syntaxin-18 N-terminal domain-containing protein n=1 Tax=Ficus carica TaxID=3494 RepID=A0AA88DKT1_FICCA|nr:hypothetical protein TIFTF001_026203 [Ficus carica]